jgi:hypothetical protein
MKILASFAIAEKLYSKLKAPFAQTGRCPPQPSVLILGAEISNIAVATTISEGRNVTNKQGNLFCPPFHLPSLP